MTGAVAPPLKPILRYPGSKYRLADWIVSFLPQHEVYVEPFLGSAAVFFAKTPARIEVLNDLDSRVVTLFRVLREQPAALAHLVEWTPYALEEYAASEAPTDDPIEAARRFLVRCWMSHAGKLGSQTGWRQGWADRNGPRHSGSARTWKSLPDRLLAAVDRLRDAIIDSRPAIEVLQTWSIAGAVVYADPPYPLSVRASRTDPTGRWARYYAHEMTDEDHLGLIDVLEAHPGPVLLSGYSCPLYDTRLTEWVRIDRQARTYRNALRTECLWLNPVAAAAARQPTLLEVLA